MKTAKQLQDIFINDREFGNKKAGVFYHFVLERIYKGHTVKDRLCMWFKINPKTFDGYKHELPKKLQDKWHELELVVKKEQIEVDRRITSRFEKYRIELNDFLIKNGYLKQKIQTEK